jgi:hypothetical protein
VDEGKMSSLLMMENPNANCNAAEKKSCKKIIVVFPPAYDSLKNSRIQMNST